LTRPPATKMTQTDHQVRQVIDRPRHYLLPQPTGMTYTSAVTPPNLKLFGWLTFREG